jgi:hypothetical protein
MLVISVTPSVPRPTARSSDRLRAHRGRQEKGHRRRRNHCKLTAFLQEFATIVLGFAMGILFHAALQLQA